MGRERRGRLARLLDWRALPLLAEIAVAAMFVRDLWEQWRIARPLLPDTSTLADRFSQLKPAAFKVPWSVVYLALFLAAIAVAAGWLWIRGVRDAVAPDHPRGPEPRAPAPRPAGRRRIDAAGRRG